MSDSDRPGENDRLIPMPGGYQRSFRTAQAVHGATVIFCDRFIDRCSGTRDQMLQAASNGLTNIEQAREASATSKTIELNLTTVARASLEELIRDVEDFLRHRSLPVWDKDSPPAREARSKLASDWSGLSDFMNVASPEQAANTLLCLVNQASFLLHRQVERLKGEFVEHGGFTERLQEMRNRAKRLDQADSSDQSDAPLCPKCAKPMRLRMARHGPLTGREFWGCSGYPDCKGTRPVWEDSKQHS